MFELIQSIHSVEVEFESGSYYCTGTCTRIDRETFTWHGMACEYSHAWEGICKFIILCQPIKDLYDIPPMF
jgi:hypothetical protein